MSIELDYIKVGDYYLPNLILDEPPELNRFIGKYADLRREYLKEHRLALWMVLVNNGAESKRPAEMGRLDERLQGAGGGSHLRRADLQLNRSVTGRRRLLGHFMRVTSFSFCG